MVQHQWHEPAEDGHAELVEQRMQCSGVVGQPSERTELGRRDAQAGHLGEHAAGWHLQAPTGHLANSPRNRRRGNAVDHLVPSCPVERSNCRRLSDRVKCSNWAAMSNAGRSNAPTLEAVAQAAGVSRALVPLVMRDSPRVSVESRRRVSAAAATLGYRPNLMARNLASRKTMTIGVLLNDLHNPWFAEVTDGIQDASERHGYQLILASGRRSPTLESRALDTFLASRVDGIIVAGCRVPAARLDAVGAEVAVVSVGRVLPRPSVGSVTTDDAFVAYLAVQHLHDLGHLPIAHIDGGKGAGAAPRRTGYLRTMRDLGLADKAQLVPGDFTEE